MEQEKIKEIKKALEHCGEKVTCQGCPEYNNEPVIDWFKCKKNLLQKTINLIYELESENEKLKNIGLNESITVGEYLKENQQLKDRIAELEKEKKELLKENEGYHGSYRCAIDKIGELSAERYIKVEQFAERLKERIKAIDKFYSKEIIDISYNGITAKEIDETLKEFINE